MAFERFTQTGRSLAAKLSIWNKGQIGFGMGAVARFKLSGYDYVVLMYDREEKRIGFMFTNDPKEEGATKLNKRKTGVMVGAKTFLDFYEINYSETRQYNMKYDENSKLYIADLKNAAQ